MNIKADQFCGLSTSPTWQAWLYKFSPELYSELATHLRTSKGCGANRDKMMDLMAKIRTMPTGPDSLLGFLQTSYPHMIDKSPAITATEPARPSGASVPFEHYDPKLLTFPRRLVLGDTDLPALHRKVRSFLSDKVRSDWAIVGNRAYIEFVPSEHARIAANIPEKNWLVTKWKRENRQ